MSRRSWIVNGSLAVVVAVVALLAVNSIFHKSSAHAAQRTAIATMGTVQATVTATGNVASGQTENLGFGTGGTVTAIDVAQGQKVTAGQVLAQIDPTSAQAALTAAQDDLTAAQDNLALAQSGGETPPQQAQDANSLSTAQTQVNTDQANLTNADNQLAADQAACAAAPATTTTSQSGRSGSGSGSTTPTACSAETGDQQAITQAQNSLTQAQNSLTQTELSIEAKRYVNPATILQDEAQVTQAQATVTADNKTLAETTLTAPFAGTITALNGSLGQTVSGGGSSAASSSTGSSGSSGSSGSGGTGASGAATSGGSSGSASSSSSGSSSSSSSSTFMTLTNLSDLQVVTGFPEADAVKVKVGQPATVTLDALTTGNVVPGTVTAVSPTSTVVSNVVTYDVTIALTNPPADVESGMSATVAVTVQSVANTLELPSSAITTTGSLSTVQLDQNGKQTTRTVTTGLVGDTTTQILSGLSVGNVVVEPSVTVSNSTGSGTTGTGTGTSRGLGGLGGGGGGFGGFGGGGGFG
jgi:multidrug efflux pump subunit AcrA (membrane-fusion protein)